MLVIPPSIKTLLASALTRKNFRVHFPNGEHSDLSNADIPVDSVRFTSSVCSETVFRFGCAERSVIEFEAVGCPSIVGAEIQCEIDVDTSALSEEELQQIEISSPTNLVREAASDLGWGYYRIPYGLFVVDNCPRDQTAMIRRRITAYSHSPRRLSPVERVRCATWRTAITPYEDISPKDILFANLGYYYPEFMGYGYSYGDFIPWETIRAAGTSFSRSYVSEDNGHTYTVEITGTKYDKILRDAGLYGVLLYGRDTTAAWEYFQSIYSGPDAPPYPEIPQPGIPADNRLPRTYLQPHITWDRRDAYSPTVLSGDHAPAAWLSGEGAPVFLATQFETIGASEATIRLMWDLTIRYRIDGVEQSSATFFPAEDATSAIRTWSDDDPWPEAIRIKPTGDIEELGSGQLRVRYIGAYDMDALLSAWLELTGAELRFNRRGEPELLRFTGSTPIDISRNQYETCWWDDYAVDPIGTLIYAYRGPDDQGEQIGSWQVSDGGSEYDLTGNMILRELADATEASVRSLLSERMLPYLASAIFVPSRITLHNMPQLDAGDWIRVQTRDPEQPYIDTRLMEQTISGVMDLRTDGSAPSGHRKDEEEL